jgi:hypothetical protein
MASAGFEPVLLGTRGQHANHSTTEAAFLERLQDTDMRRFTMGIRYEKCVVRQFRLANTYLHKPRYYRIAYHIPRLCGIAFCS